MPAALLLTYFGGLIVFSLIAMQWCLSVVYRRKRELAVMRRLLLVCYCFLLLLLIAGTVICGYIICWSYKPVGRSLSLYWGFKIVKPVVLLLTF